MKSLEKSLLISVIIFTTASVLLALFIGLILPEDWMRVDYVCGRNKKEALSKCRCKPDGIQKPPSSTAAPPSETEKPPPEPEPTEPTPEDTEEGEDSEYAGSPCLLKDQRSSRKLQEGNIEMIANYPYLVSLNTPAYADDKSERLFACNGVILNKQWILVGDYCLYRTTSYKLARVRTGSPHWSIKGSIHQIKSVAVGSEGLSAISVTPFLRFDAWVQSVNLPISTLQIPPVLSTPGWDLSYSEPLQNRFMYKSFVVDSWGTEFCHTCEKAIIRNNNTCGKFLDGRPLMIGCDTLVGFQCAKEDKNGPAEFITLNNHQAWIYTLLNITDGDDCTDLYAEMDGLEIYKRHCCEEIAFDECFSKFKANGEKDIHTNTDNVKK